MKRIVACILAICASVVFGHVVETRPGIIPQRLPPIDLTQVIFPEGLKEEHVKTLLEYKDLGSGSVIADITEYVDKILKNVKEIIINNGLDPMELSNETIKFPVTGSIKLTDGWLEDASTIGTYDKVVVKYVHDTQILDILLPLSFNQLLLTYKYKTEVLVLSIKGDVNGKVNNVKINLHMGFNLTSFHAFVDKVDVKDTGKIEVKFTGLGLLDWVIDLMSNAVVGLLHGIILTVVNIIIKDPVDDIVNDINQAIDNIIHNITVV